MVGRSSYSFLTVIHLLWAITNVTWAQPSAPTAIGATNITQESFDAHWEAVAGAGSYELDISTDLGFTTIVDNQSGLSGTSYSATGLAAGTDHYYRVRAVNTGGTSGNSNVIEITTLPEVPGPPMAIAATDITRTSFVANWQAEAGTDSYELDIATDEGFAAIIDEQADLEGTSYSTTSLIANTGYYYRVRAVNAGGTSVNSNMIQVTTLPNAPSAPVANMATNITRNSFDANWQAGANADSYALDIATDAGFASIVDTQSGLAGNSYSAAGLNADTDYYYRVRAINLGGASGNSNVIQLTTLPNPPGSPSDLTLEVKSQTRIDLSWTDNSDNEENFIIEMSVSGSAFETIASLNTNTNIYAHTGLASNTEYTYRVKATNPGGGSAYSNTVMATTMFDIPTAPSRLGLDVLSQTAMRLSWTDESDLEDGFRIERSDGNDMNFRQVIAVGADNETYEDESLEANTLYFYRVRAFNVVGTSEPSNEASSTTLPNPPAVPSNLNAVSTSQTGITLTWSDNADNEVDFVLERSFNESSNFQVLATLPADQVSYDDTGLTANTFYYYRLKARNSGGETPYTGVSSAITFPTPPTATAAAPVTNSDFVAHWTSVPNAIKYLVDVSRDDFNTFVPGFEAAEVLATSVRLTSLSPETTYKYRVRAVNEGGISSYSNVISAITLPDPTGAPVALPASSVLQVSFRANWESVTGADTYELDVASDINFLDIVQGITGITGLSQGVAGLTADQSYYYRARAINAGGKSPNSNTIAVTTLPDPTDPPVANAGQSIGKTSFIASWNDVEGADSYEVDVAEDNDFIGILPSYDATPTTATSLQVSGLEPGTVYFYRVRTVNTGGRSGNSNVVPVTTLPLPPSAPSDVVVTALSQAEIEITWTDNSTREDSFVIEQSIGNDLNFTTLTNVAANTTSFVVTGLTENTSYYYRLKAVNTGGESAYTIPVSTTTFPIAPDAPTLLVLLEAFQTEAGINWIDNANNESNFRVLRKLEGATSFDTIAVLGQDVTSYSDVELSSMSSYTYKVRAENRGGASDFSNELTVTTLQFSPTLDPIESVIVRPGSQGVQVALAGISAGPGEEQAITITATTDNEILISNMLIAYTGPGVIGNLSFDVIAGLTDEATITVRVEDDGPVGEGNVNFIERAFTVLVTDQPDLVVQNIGVSPILLNAGEEINISGQVRNIGHGAAAASTLKYYLSADQTLQLTTDLLLGSSAINILADGAVFNTNVDLQIPATVLPESYWIIFFADADGAIEEIDETNNTTGSLQVEVVSINAPRIISTDFPGFIVQGDEGINIGIVAEDDVGISTVEFIFKGISGKDWQTRDIIPTSNTIAITVPANDFDEIGIEYYFKVFNLPGLSTESLVGYTYIKTQPVGDEIPGLSFGREQSDYNIISIPLELTNNTISGILEDDLGPYDRKVWRLFHYAGDQGGVLEYGRGFTSFEIGKGYWLISADPVIIDTGEGTTVRVSAEHPFVLDLEQGWNQVGNPFRFNVLWEDVLTFNGNPPAIGNLRVFENGTFTNGEILGAYQGGFVFASENMSLEIPFSKNKNANGSRSAGHRPDPLESPLDSDAWHILFNISCEGHVSGLGGIGMHYQADVGKDRFDQVALPALGIISCPQLIFSHPEFFYPSFSKDMVPIRDHHVWKFNIETPFEGEAVLSWYNSYFGENDKTLLLYDTRNNKLVDLREYNTYLFNARQVDDFELHFGTLDQVRQSIQPKSISVGKAYPNPFHRQMTLPVTLLGDHQHYDVTLTVYNLLGVVVYEHHHKQVSPGFHEISWDLTSQKGTELNDGIHFCQMIITSGSSRWNSTQRVIYKGQ